MSSFWSLQLLAQTGFDAGQQQGILDLVRGSSLVVQGVLYLLILFSVVSWGIIFYKYRQVRISKNESERFVEIFWESRNLASIHDASRELRSSPVAQVFRAGYEELLRVSRSKKESSHGEGLTTELGGVDNVTRAMKRATSVEITKLEKVSDLPGHNREHDPVYRALRHRLGDHERLPGSQRHPLLQHPGGRPRYRRSPDRYCGGPGRSDPCADGLQPLRPEDQGLDCGYGQFLA